MLILFLCSCLNLKYSFRQKRITKIEINRFEKLVKNHYSINVIVLLT